MLTSPTSTPMRTGLLTLALSILATGCASTNDEPAAHLPGCYYFDQDEVFRELRLPWGVRLEEEALEGWPAMQQRDARRAVTLTGTAEEDHPFGYWVATAPDSVEVGYPGGGGLVLELAIEEDRGLRGLARPVGDVIDPNDPAPRQSHPVHLMWARCP